jgi:hypothetical protein
VSPGFLGFLMAGRMEGTNASPFDVFAFFWFSRSAGSNFACPGC